MADNGQTDQRTVITHFINNNAIVKCGNKVTAEMAQTEKHRFTKVEDEVTCADCRTALGLPPLE